MATPFPFQSGNTLLASQLNAITTLPSTTKTASHTLVIADQGTRVIMNVATANTVTVDTSIFGAGDIVEIQNIGAGVCTVTAGTATVSSAGPLAIPQNGGGRLIFSSASAATYFPTAVTATAPGLTLISRTTSGPSATINYDGVFTSVFSAYTVILESVVGTTDSDLQCKLRVGSTTISAAYDFAGTGLTTGNNAANFANTNQSVMIFSRVSTSINRSTMTFYGVGNASEKAFFTSLSYTDEGVGKNFNVGGMCNTADTYTGFQLSAGSGNITATVAIYGMAK